MLLEMAKCDSLLSARETVTIKRIQFTRPWDPWDPWCGRDFQCPLIRGLTIRLTAWEAVGLKVGHPEEFLISCYEFRGKPWWPHGKARPNFWTRRAILLIKHNQTILIWGSWIVDPWKSWASSKAPSRFRLGASRLGPGVSCAAPQGSSWLFISQLSESWIESTMIIFLSLHIYHMFYIFFIIFYPNVPTEFHTAKPNAVTLMGSCCVGTASSSCHTTLAYEHCEWLLAFRTEPSILKGMNTLWFNFSRSIPHLENRRKPQNFRTNMPFTVLTM